MPKFVIWISELNSRLSRRLGREVPKTVAIENPELQEVLDVINELRIKVLNIDDALNPRLSGVDENVRSKGRIFVESPYSKGKTLRRIAEKIRERRKRFKRKKKR